MPERRRHAEIDEPGAGHGSLRNLGRKFQIRADDLGDRARRLLLAPRHHERYVASRVAVSRILGRLDARGGGRRRGELPGGARTLDGAAQDGNDQVFHLKVGRILKSDAS